MKSINYNKHFLGLKDLQVSISIIGLSMTGEEILDEAALFCGEISGTQDSYAAQRLPVLLTATLEDLLERDQLGVWQKRALHLAIQAAYVGWYGITANELLQVYSTEEAIDPTPVVPALDEMTADYLIKAVARLPNAPVIKLNNLLERFGQSKPKV